MLNIGRPISLMVRRSDARKDCRRVLRTFAEWRAIQAGLPPPDPAAKTLLLIRLDDIGDYLLFRNQLAMYKRSPRWQGYEVTLLGNESWRDLFVLLDADSVDRTIWVNKKRYLEDAEYRLAIWVRLRRRGVDTVVAASCTRPLLLDDLCLLAAAPRVSFGNANTNVHAAWNELSDSLYTQVFVPARPLMHEFHFNGEFAEWLCGMRHPAAGPVIDRRFPPPQAEPYILCFLGASTRSRRWPVKRWIRFIDIHREGTGDNIFLSGNSRTEIDMAEAIEERTGAKSIAGMLALPAIMAWVAGAKAVVTNDTMAAHMSASFARPTVIVANGINYMRFSDYGAVDIDCVVTVFPEVVNRRRRRDGDGPYAYSETVSSDIASIRAETVSQALKDLLGSHAAGATPSSRRNRDEQDVAGFEVLPRKDGDTAP